MITSNSRMYPTLKAENSFENRKMIRAYSMIMTQLPLLQKGEPITFR